MHIDAKGLEGRKDKVSLQYCCSTLCMHPSVSSGQLPLNTQQLDVSGHPGPDASS